MIKDTLVRHPLNCEKALAFLKSNLDDLNMLSIAVYEHVKFEEGQFYTYAKKNLTQKQLHEFTLGGIGFSTRYMIEDMVFHQLTCNKNYSGIFDSFEETYDPNDFDPLFSTVGAHYKNEVYYIVSYQTLSQEIIQQCFKESFIIWHALCILSDIKFSSNKDYSIEPSTFVNFAKKAQIIILGAYDGEGYIIWEKNLKNDSDSF